MNKYVTPDFDVTVYEIEDVITVSSGTGIEGGNAQNSAGNVVAGGWWG